MKFHRKRLITILFILIMAGIIWICGRHCRSPAPVGVSKHGTRNGKISVFDWFHEFHFESRAWRVRDKNVSVKYLKSCWFCWKWLKSFAHGSFQFRILQWNCILDGIQLPQYTIKHNKHWSLEWFGIKQIHRLGYVHTARCTPILETNWIDCRRGHTNHMSRSKWKQYY